jgi:hypothetical protein
VYDSYRNIRVYFACCRSLKCHFCEGTDAERRSHWDHDRSCGDIKGIWGRSGLLHLFWTILPTVVWRIGLGVVRSIILPSVNLLGLAVQFCTITKKVNFMFNLSFNLQVTLIKNESSVSKKVDVPETEVQVDRNKKSETKTTLVDWMKLVSILYYVIRFGWWILTLIIS